MNRLSCHIKPSAKILQIRVHIKRLLHRYIKQTETHQLSSAYPGKSALHRTQTLTHSYTHTRIQAPARARMSFVHISVNTSPPQGRRHSGAIAISIAVSRVITVTVAVGRRWIGIGIHGWHIAGGRITGGHVESIVVMRDHLMAMRRDDGRHSDRVSGRGQDSGCACDGGGDAMRGRLCHSAADVVQESTAAEQKNELRVVGGSEK